MTPPPPADAAEEAPAVPSPRAPTPLALALCVPPLYALDQWTKWLVVRRIDPRDAREMIPNWFYLVHWTNRGAAWGMFQNGSLFFLALAVAALAALAVFWWRRAFVGGWAAAGVCLLVPGILGNLTDRLARGEVIDFLLFDLHFPGAHPFPAFNVADSCICVAVGCFLIGSLRAPAGPAQARG